MHQITVSGITVDIVRKNIKNLHLAVYPPSGRVRVAAPLRVDDEAVRLFTISKLGWIRRQQAKFVAQERQTARELVSGESHYYQGRRYRLKVIYHDGPGKIVLRNKATMELHACTGSDTTQRNRILQAWYRKQLKELVPAIIEKWEPIIGVEVAEWAIKQMKTKWGTCNIEARRIWLNLELAKKSVHCLEYIVVHEMVHLLERHHNERFVGYMDQFLPQWRFLREELNRDPLGHEEWGY